ncbi:MAG TPA: helix-turn-helix domain-containing protein [Pseudonocardiaceae bacterium]|nr:helix-turn-helix domain-containing protein [Pseudonocardiaceae bacterium]
MVGHALDVCSGPVVAPDPQCPVEITLAALRGRWTPLVLGEFFRHGELSFSELAAALPGLSDKVLSQRLNHLTDAGIVERRRTPSWPPRVRYSLTERGRTSSRCWRPCGPGVPHTVPRPGPPVRASGGWPRAASGRDGR